MVNDPIGDLLAQIRNAYMSGKKTVSLPHSKMKEELARILAREEFVKNVDVTSEKSKSTFKKTLVITLKYTGEKPALEKVIRMSKPGRKMYVQRDNLPPVLSGYGISIISTSKGLLTDDDARKNHIGGELICKLW